MSEIELKLLREAANCTLYTIQFTEDSMDEYGKFFARFKDDLLYSRSTFRGGIFLP